MQGFAVNTVNEQASTALRNRQQVRFGCDHKSFAREQYAVLVYQVERQGLTYADGFNVDRDQVHLVIDYACGVSC